MGNTESQNQNESRKVLPIEKWPKVLHSIFLMGQPRLLIYLLSLYFNSNFTEKQ